MGSLSIKGGYKTYRKEINNSLNSIINNYKYIVLRGKTGTAKTKILEMIINKGGYALNLENLAKHKGSLLGKLPKSSQPSQKYFESLIYFELKKLRKNKPVLVESESSKIGNLYLPSNLLYKIENSPCIDIESNINARASYLVKDYSKFILKKNSFNELFLYASSKLGKEVVNKWKKNYENKNWKELALQLIVEYYDPLYSHKKNQKKNLSIESHNFKTLNHASIEKFCSYLIKKALLIKFYLSVNFIYIVFNYKKIFRGNMFLKKYLKWISTFLVLNGILLTNLNFYPINLFFHGLGVIGWTIAGFILKDKAILTNFGLQIPLFIIGFTNLILAS